jgi:hypothetical protein
VNRVKTRDGKWAARGDSVSVPAYEGRLAVVVGTRKGCALLEFGTGVGAEWVPGSAIYLARRRKGLVTADGCRLVPGMAVTTVTGGYAVHGITGRPGWMGRLSGRVPVEFADGSEACVRGTDLYVRDEEDLYLLWT